MLWDAATNPRVWRPADTTGARVHSIVIGMCPALRRTDIGVVTEQARYFGDATAVCDGDQHSTGMTSFITSLKCFRFDGQAQFRRGVIGDGWCEVDGARRWRQRAHNNRRGSMMVLWQQPEARAQQKLASSARAVDSTQLHLLLRRRRSRTTTTTTRWSSSGLSDCRFGMTLAWQCVLHRNGARLFKGRAIQLAL